MCDICWFVAINSDFNFSNINWSHDLDVLSLPVYTLAFTNFVISNELTQLIKDSTHNQNFLHLLIVNDPLTFYNSSLSLSFSFSNHCNHLSIHGSLKTCMMTRMMISIMILNMLIIIILLNCHQSNIGWHYLFLQGFPGDVEGI